MEFKDVFVFFLPFVEEGTKMNDEKRLTDVNASSLLCAHLTKMSGILPGENGAVFADQIDRRAKVYT